MHLDYDADIIGMRTGTGAGIPLESVNVEVDFSNLLSRTTLTQTYRNTESKPIEAVYTFPLAADAVLLGMEVRIGKRKLQGVVVEKSCAEEQYEDAISEGNTAIMLERLPGGLYTMNVGNIQSHERIAVEITYAELHSWNNDTIRYFLPTTIAPRYGDPEDTGLEPHQVPEYDIQSENCFCLNMNIAGSLAMAEISSPSHNVTISESGKQTNIHLAAGDACMDRDFILNICQSQNKKDVILIEREAENRFVALASFQPQLPPLKEVPPKSIKIVVDCSGSMNGDSINQARQAIGEILNQLRPEDFFNIITFGSTSNPLFKQQMQAEKANLVIARRALRSIEADMGGTEIQAALKTVMQITGPSISQDIFLITDGEVWESDKIIRSIRKSGQRIFTVGVGSSVSENFVRQLADETGGACELVAPNEQMAAKIVRHFQRIYLQQAQNVTINWPMVPEKNIPADIGSVYDGDTLHAFAFFNEAPTGTVTLEMTLANGQILCQRISIGSQEQSLPDPVPGPIARMAIHRSLAQADKDETINLAVQYQLISPFTNFLVVDELIDEKRTGDIPLLRKVPQTLAAGWGGCGSVSESMLDYDTPKFSRTCDNGIRFSMMAPPEQVDDFRQQSTPAEFIRKCNQLHDKHFRLRLRIKTYDDLLGCDLPDIVLAAIQKTSSNSGLYLGEDEIVLAFLLRLSKSSVGYIFSKKFLNSIRKTEKNRTVDKHLIECFNNLLTGTSAANWGPGIVEESRI